VDRVDKGVKVMSFLRFILPFAVPEDCNVHIPITGAHGFLGMSIPAVIGLFIAVIVFGIPKFLIKLFVKSPFQYGTKLIY